MLCTEPSGQQSTRALCGGILGSPAQPCGIVALHGTCLKSLQDEGRRDQLLWDSQLCWNSSQPFHLPPVSFCLAVKPCAVEVQIPSSVPCPDAVGTACISPVFPSGCVSPFLLSITPSLAPSNINMDVFLHLHCPSA